MDKDQAIIVGGGIGGLTAALMLGRSGLRVRVLERADEFAGPFRSGSGLPDGGGMHRLAASVPRLATPGGPARRWDGERDSAGLDHGDYWSDPGCIKRIARTFALPQERKPNQRTSSERLSEERNPPNRMSVSHSFLAAAGGAPVGPM